MPIVNIQLLAGRDAQQIEGLIADITETVARKLQVRPEQVRVLITEISATHWGVGGKSKRSLESES